MKLWIEPSYYYNDDPMPVKLGLNWYKHSPKHPYFGFTVGVIFFGRWFEINYVDNFKKYDFVINCQNGKYPHRSRYGSNK